MIDSVPGKFCGTVLITFDLSVAVDLVLRESPGFKCFFGQQNKGPPVTLPSRGNFFMEWPLSLKNVVCCILSSHTGHSEPKDFIRKSFFSVSSVFDSAL